MIKISKRFKKYYLGNKSSKYQRSSVKRNKNIWLKAPDCACGILLKVKCWFGKKSLLCTKFWQILGNRFG